MPKVEPRVLLLQYTPDSENLIATAAKLCYSKSGIEELKDGVEARDQTKFLNRLTEMSHLSPIEHASFTFAIGGVSRSFLAQITRHRVASFSVQSQRYVGQKHEGEDDFDYIVPPAVEALGKNAVARYSDEMRQMQRWYNEWVAVLGDAGEKSNEDARFVLPNAASTQMIVTMNARELMHFFALRCCGRAQWEIREVAWLMLELCREKAPALFANAGPACLKGECSEGRMCCGKAEEMRKKSELLNGGGKNG